ncbi:HAD-like domain-containing protein [Xylariales sp. PMI_506]|nr:HAD-like domain-containing protein [Xylariales sp. PMI_506]
MSSQQFHQVHTTNSMTTGLDPTMVAFVPRTDGNVPRQQSQRYPPNPNSMGRVRGKKLKSERQVTASTASLQPKKVKRLYAEPSAASGGVPNASILYLTRSAEPPAVLPYPRHILVVMDLNGTLLHRPSPKNPSRFVERPFARTFLDYCLRTFTVAIWSSTKPENVQKMLPRLLSPTDQGKIVAIWGRDTLGLSHADYNQRVQCYKRLEVLWADPNVAASHPDAAIGGRWDQTNTVLVDDSNEKARTEPYNLIQLPEFEGDINEQGFVLPQVHDYLNLCAQQQNISAFIRTSPFVINQDFKLGG